jgi:hypothetical protein
LAVRRLVVTTGEVSQWVFGIEGGLVLDQPATVRVAIPGAIVKS